MDLTIDLTTAARRRLVAHPPFTALVLGGLIGTELSGSDYTETEILESAWVFQGLTDDGRPFRDVEGSGLCCVVLTSRTEWSTNNHNTVRFPRLQVLIYADSSRDETGAHTDRDADIKCKDVAKAVDDCFHMLNTEDEHQWPGLYVVSCVRSQGLSIMDVPLTEGLTVRGEIIYDAMTD